MRMAVSLEKTHLASGQNRTDAARWEKYSAIALQASNGGLSNLAIYGALPAISEHRDNEGKVMAADTDRLMQGMAVPADATFFTFRRGATWFILLALLFALTEAVVLLFEAWFTPDPTTRVTQIPEGVFLALVAELNWRFFRSSWHRIAVNAEGIWSVRLRNTSFLAWRNLAHVQANDAMQRLELADASGLTEIQVEYQLKDFGRLRDFILSHTAESAQVQSSGMGAFRRSWEYKIIYAVIASALLFIAWFVYRHVTGHVFLLPVALGAVGLVLFFLDPVSLVIDHDRISIKYPGYQRTILLSSISEITLSDRRYRGNVWAGVLIARKAGRPIRLTRFSGGSVALRSKRRGELRVRRRARREQSE
jgi:hypothetical protein